MWGRGVIASLNHCMDQVGEAVRVAQPGTGWRGLWRWEPMCLCAVLPSLGGLQVHSRGCLEEKWCGSIKGL